LSKDGEAQRRCNESVEYAELNVLDDAKIDGEPIEKFAVDRSSFSDIVLGLEHLISSSCVNEESKDVFAVSLFWRRVWGFLGTGGGCFFKVSGGEPDSKELRGAGIGWTWTIGLPMPLNPFEAKSCECTLEDNGITQCGARSSLELLKRESVWRGGLSGFSKRSSGEIGLTSVGREYGEWYVGGCQLFSGRIDRYPLESTRFL
jgi:hypothetical protein